MNTTEPAWFKSSYSSGSGDSCVEVANTREAILVRDSKIEQSPRLTLSPASWATFVSYATTED
ncbi:DUF397 domain-containing protein [Streptomyces sp. TP-A0874]|uniref:DUF397 domain-containing protein n=1 Tax=Streptomyces sp. TP-A0874 TaxID=549819 RepID=UPI000852EDE4|nr:DUF397 domain-containing protein [Streptomyces sp. TP-A0874]